MIQNRNMTRAAKKRIMSFFLDISDANYQIDSVLDRENDIKITRADVLYAVATDGGTRTSNIQLGTHANATLYFDFNPAASTAVGTLASIALSSAALVPAGTGLVLRRNNLTGGTNTGEVLVTVQYELVDNRYEA